MRSALMILQRCKNRSRFADHGSFSMKDMDRMFHTILLHARASPGWLFDLKYGLYGGCVLGTKAQSAG
jgi:hypothetical protein